MAGAGAHGIAPASGGLAPTDGDVLIQIRAAAPGPGDPGDRRSVSLRDQRSRHGLPR